jgi:hypothetical protein
MVFNEQVDLTYLAISELSKEIGYTIETCFNWGFEYLSSHGAEHILKITSDVTHRVKPQILELTV